MNQDPAFLFYPKDYREETSMMLPVEKACLMDLKCYQHQHGPIPDDIRRLTIYCNGISEETIRTVLGMCFKNIDGFFIHQDLQKIINNRKEYSKKQAVNGSVGQFWKKAIALLSKDEIQTLRDNYNQLSNEDFYNKYLKKIDLKNKTTLKATLEGMLEASLKYLANGNANGNANENGKGNKGKGGAGEKPKVLKIPSLDEFINYGKERDPSHSLTDQWFKNKYTAWSDNDWYTNQEKPRKIKNWKSTLANTVNAVLNNNSPQKQKQDVTANFNNGDRAGRHKNVQELLNVSTQGTAYYDEESDTDSTIQKEAAFN